LSFSCPGIGPKPCSVHQTPFLIQSLVLVDSLFMSCFAETRTAIPRICDSFLAARIWACISFFLMLNIFDAN
jgi:hypothetical protein